MRVFTGARGVDQVIIVHPTLAMTQLHAHGGVSANLWQQFNKILVDTGAWKSPEEEVAAVASQAPVLIPDVDHRAGDHRERGRHRPGSAGGEDRARCSAERGGEGPAVI